MSASSAATPPLQITYRDPDSLQPREKNPRTHSRAQLKQLARSIRKFGFTNPVLVDERGRIIAGHGRVEAAKQIGLGQVPTIAITGLNEAQIRALVIADNKIAENAGWDPEILSFELGEIASLDIELAIDTGFAMAEIDSALGNNTHKPDPDDEQPEVAAGPAVTRAGDLWQIGPHRLYCGDSTLEASYAALLGGERAQLVFTDPPYNVKIEGHVSGLGKQKHREFAMASGEMSEAEFTGFLQTVFQNLASFSVDGAIHFVCMDWRHMGEVLAAARGTYGEFKNLCVWVKNNGGMGTLYRSRHELIFVFKSGTGPYINNVELGANGRYRSNVFEYAGINSFGKTRSKDLEMHPTVKPVSLVSDAILDCSHQGGIVLDAFGGSGTTLVAAHRTRRCGYAIELDPLYCDTIVRRMARVAKLPAILAATGQSFEEVASDRLAGSVEHAAASPSDAAGKSAIEPMRTTSSTLAEAAS